jgi:2-haloacid dehalogenase
MEALTGIRACVFDAYGTLFDYGSATAGVRDELGADFLPLTSLWRDKQLQYSWLRTCQGRHADFWQVTADALDFALESIGRSDPVLRERLMNLYLKLDTFAEVPSVLRTLRDEGYRIAILSNGSPRMLNAIVDNSGIRDYFEAVLSVEEVQTFKPHPDVYRLAEQRLRLSSDQILFCSSNAWDAYAASAFGLRVIWCNRYDQRAERLPGAPDRVVRSLAELPALLGTAHSS